MLPRSTLPYSRQRGFQQNALGCTRIARSIIVPPYVGGPLMIHQHEEDRLPPTEARGKSAVSRTRLTASVYCRLPPAYWVEMIRSSERVATYRPVSYTERARKESKPCVHASRAPSACWCHLFRSFRYWWWPRCWRL